jgi:hypothetical protein
MLSGVPSPFPVQELQRLSENPFLGEEEAGTVPQAQESATLLQSHPVADVGGQQRLVRPAISWEELCSHSL